MRVLAGNDYYAICNTVEPGLFENERYVTIGNQNNIELIVSTSSMRQTKDGLLAVRFHLSKIEDGQAKGFVYNCEDGWPSGRREIPLDSLSPQEDTLRFGLD